MPPETELITAVVQRPDDDKPRLAYAEWSAAQPEAWRKGRAEFIRCQIALAELPPPTDRGELFKLRHSELDLQDTYSQFWDRTLAAMVKGMAYDRGFVELIAVDAQSFLDQGAELKRLSPIRHLKLTAVAPVAESLFASPLLSDIRSLEMPDCGLGDAEIAILAASPHLKELRWLSLLRNRVGQAGAASLATSHGLPQLGYVVFAGNVIDPNEKYSYDNGLVVDSGLPEDGRRLEQRFGPLRWLHHAAKSYDDSEPDRFRMPPVGESSDNQVLLEGG